MKSIAAAAITCVLLAGCVSAEIAPVPGSITYNGQPQTKLTRSPIGSTFSHEFYDGSRVVEETYQIQPDRNLKIVRREYHAIFPD